MAARQGAAAASPRLSPDALSPAASRAARLGLCLLLALLVLKAASTDLTWDESWTYLFYGRSWLGFTRLDYANDHSLNSFLIFCVTRLTGAKSELAIRTPNILAAIAYFVATYALLTRVRVPVFAASVCLMQPYLFNYFAEARGYGIAAALVQVGLVSFFFVRDDARGWAVLLACLFAASLAIFHVFVITFSVAGALVAMAFLAPRGRAAIAWRALHPGSTLAFLALSAIPMAGLLQVSRPGVPLFGSEASFFAAIPLSVARFYVPPAWADSLAWLLIAIPLAAAVAFRGAWSPRTLMLGLASMLCLAITYASARLLHKPLPTDRLLLPFLPLWILTAVGMADDLHGHLAGRARMVLIAILGLVGVCLLTSFVAQLRFTADVAFPDERDIQGRMVRDLLDRGCLGRDLMGTYSRFYYAERWMPGRADRLQVPCP